MVHLADLSISTNNRLAPEAAIRRSDVIGMPRCAPPTPTSSDKEVGADLGLPKLGISFRALAYAGCNHDERRFPTSDFPVRCIRVDRGEAVRTHHSFRAKRLE